MKTGRVELLFSQIHNEVKAGMTEHMTKEKQEHEKAQQCAREKKN